jgi:hypothetical protein
LNLQSTLLLLVMLLFEFERKSELKRGNGIADQILQNAPDTCDIKIVCEGKEVINRMIGWSSPSSTENSFKSKQQEDQPNGSFWGMCFNF